MNSRTRKVRPFTGKHAALTICAFFGVIIAVNLVMAWNAIRTFSGTVIDNSYVASQNYNSWLAEARAQEELGWNIAPDAGSDGRVVLTAESMGEPMPGMTLTAVASHPFGHSAEQHLAFDAMADGRYRAQTALSPGRWQLRIEARRDGHIARYLHEVRM
ncbi:MAG: FixH family protein [Sphingomonadaceae bacterium]